jgi:hypothetical protein
MHHQDGTVMDVSNQLKAFVVNGVTAENIVVEVIYDPQPIVGIVNAAVLDPGIALRSSNIGYEHLAVFTVVNFAA